MTGKIAYRGAPDVAIWQHLSQRCPVVSWICPLTPGTRADVLIWDRVGAQQAKGQFKDYVHLPVPYGS